MKVQLIIPILLLSLLSTSLKAQEAATKTKATNARDFIMFQFGYTDWANAPDSIKNTGANRVFNLYIMNDWQLQNKHFSFSAGLGIGTDNNFFNNQIVSATDSNNSILFLPEYSGQNNKRFKMAVTYLEAPFELRYKANTTNGTKGFKAAIGLRVGNLLNVHYKATRPFSGGPIRTKESTKRFVNKWRVAPTLRIGYGNITAFGTYNLNSLFKDGSGPQVSPWSAGICISGL
jgi:hypothetical protein